MAVEMKTFERFFNQFTARYGQTRMNSETMSMWIDKLTTLENDAFIKASEHLLGSKDIAFGWKAVSDLILVQKQGPDKQLELEKKWLENPDYKNNMDKKIELSNVMKGIIDKIEHNKKRGVEQSDWRGEYAKHFVRVWGPTEARRIAVEISKDSAYRGFAAKVFGEIER